MPHECLGRHCPVFTGAVAAHGELERDTLDVVSGSGGLKVICNTLGASVIGTHIDMERLAAAQESGSVSDEHLDAIAAGCPVAIAAVNTREGGQA